MSADDHGSYSTYVNWGCRCDECRNANTAYARQRRERRRTEPLPGFVQHGSQSAYTNWACRCPECTSAARRRYHARKASA